MAQIPRLEYALSEYAVFEYAHEDLGGSDLQLFGEASVDLTAGAFFDARTYVSGTSETTLYGAYAHSGEYEVSGSSLVSLAGQSYDFGTLTVAGVTSTGIYTQNVLVAQITSSGSSYTFFPSQAVIPGLTSIEAKSISSFLGQSTNFSNVLSVGAGYSFLEGSLASLSTYSIAGITFVDLAGSIVLASPFMASGEATSKFGGETLHTGGVHTQGEANTTLNSQTYRNANLDLGSHKASVQFIGSMGVYSDLEAQGSSTVEIDVTGSGNTYIYFSGHTETLWEGGRALAARSYIGGLAKTSLEGSRKLLSEVDIEGMSGWIFQPQDNPEVTIRGRSQTLFKGQSEYSSTFVGESSVDVQLKGLARSNSRVRIVGTTETGLSGQAYRLGTITVRGRARVELSASKRVTAFTDFTLVGKGIPKIVSGKGLITSFEAKGKSKGLLNGATALPTHLFSNGLSVFQINGEATGNGVFDFLGSSSSSFLSNEVKLSQWKIEGTSISYYYVGSVVFTSLPRAYDYVIREYEPRSIERQAEVRSAEFI